MRVGYVCGEIRTQYTDKKMNDGSYEIVVATAGALNDML